MCYIVCKLKRFSLIFKMKASRAWMCISLQYFCRNLALFSVLWESLKHYVTHNKTELTPHLFTYVVRALDFSWRFNEIGWLSFSFNKVKL